MPRTRVSIVGGGPVGLLGSLLLQSFGVDYVCYEKFQKLRSHPSAHWVSARSKQILSQIEGMAQRVDENQQTFSNFQYYRYMEKIGGTQFGHKNHFLPSISEKLKESYSFFQQHPSHISQSKLLALQYEQLKKKERILFNQQIVSVTKKNDIYQLKNNRNQVVGESQYVILSNGIRSELRDHLNIRMNGQQEIFKIINIHFKSIALAQIITQQKSEAMLHFIYNSQAPSVLVNHSLLEGEFVLQIPNYQPFVDLMEVYSPEELVQMAVSAQSFQHIKKDLEIIHFGKWKLQALLAERMAKDNIFLAGDTAHTYTPAGGFGMNCGFQDINHLTHTLHSLIRNPKANHSAIIQMYNDQRLDTNQKYLQKSLSNYKITQNIAAQLGFPAALTQYYFRFCQMVPITSFSFAMRSLQKIRLLSMQGLFKKRRINPELELFFDEFDFKVQKLSKCQNKIIQHTRRRQFYDWWVDNSVNLSEVEAILGNIDKSHIKFVKLPEGQRIIRRDGIVIK